MKNTIGIAALAALVLSACAVKSFKTTGPLAQPLALKTIQVSYEPEASIGFSMTKGGGRDVRIDDTDKARATASATTLNRLFIRGVKEKLPQDAPKYGLAVTSGGAGAAKLKISVLSFTSRCNGSSCVDTIRVSGVLTNTAGAQLWKFITEVGNRSIYDDQVNDQTFEAFEKAMFEQMQADGVIAKN